MVALSTAFYARLSIGSRQIVEIFNILNEFMGNIFGEVPAYTTIGYWAQELGLSVYKESCTLFKGKRYALIVDESMMIGSEKMLLTLAVAADNIGMAITEKNITIYNPQNEMLAFCKTKCSIRKTKRIFLRVPSYTKL